MGKKKAKRDEEREQRITDEIVVDCYNEDERATGWSCYLGDQLQKTMGFASVLADDPDLPAELRRFAENAVQGVRDADETLRRLLRLTRLEENVQLAGHPIVDLERSSEPEADQPE